VTQAPQPKLSGLFGFTVVMIGQVVSLIGTAMSGFALTIWAYQLTGSATALALVGFFFVTPMLLLSPLAGALVDRSNRKLMMMLSDLASGLATVAVLILYTSGHLQIWHLYIANAVSGAFQAFQWPAFSAAITTMMPKEQYGRANGMMALAESGSGILAPVLAGALLGIIGLGGVLAIDVITFCAAILALLMVHVPQPQTTAVGQASRGSLWQESIFGFRYIWQRPSLLGLQLVFMTGNFLATISYTLMAPMILARTGNDALSLGTVSSIGAIGGVIGGLVMSAWGGTKRKVHGVLTGWMLSGLFETLLGLGRTVPVWAVSSFIGQSLAPWINGSNQAIWQAKVAPDVQGKVFSIRRLIAWFTLPAGTLIAGPLADYVMEPAMMQPTSSWLSRIFAPLVGTGPGAGMALIIVLCGLGIVAVGLSGYAVHVIRNAELLMPDYEEGLVPETAETIPAD
jgi:MFS transporter, DHA3 family, macrolide efflux protein